MPKTITGSVGRGGKNYPPSDVMTVQYLLNCVLASQGGSPKELAVDGAAGPKTIAAIEGFQRKLGGFADGRVDPGGATLRALQGHDPYPNQTLAADAAKSGVGGKAKSGQTGTDPWAKQGAPGSPASKDAFGNSMALPPVKTVVDPFGNTTKGGMASPGYPTSKTNVPVNKGGMAMPGFPGAGTGLPSSKGGSGGMIN